MDGKLRTSSVSFQLAAVVVTEYTKGVFEEQDIAAIAGARRSSPLRHSMARVSPGGGDAGPQDHLRCGNGLHRIGRVAAGTFFARAAMLPVAVIAASLGSSLIEVTAARPPGP